ncbi:hypothetical protein KKE33_01890 [Patescibacteria group bacterium]|nr:hypothetical protein [Patescibacteria group bacterium]
MQWIKWKEFFVRYSVGLFCTGVGIVIWMLIFGIVSLAKSTNNNGVDTHNQAALKDWENRAVPILLRNAVIKSLEAGSVAGIEFPKGTENEEAFLKLALLVVNGKTADARIRAFKDFHKVSEIPVNTSYGLVVALQNEKLTPSERYDKLYAYIISNQAQSKSETMIMHDLTRDWLKGARPELKELPDKPKAEEPYVYNWFALTIFALVLYALAQIIMGFFYFGDTNDRYGNREYDTWAIPANPLGWLLMIPFAPAFAFPWIGRGVYWAIMWPATWLVWQSGRGLKWALVDFDLSVPPRKIREWRETRREAKRRKRAAEEVRAAEEAVLGQDVIRAGLKLKHLQELAKLEKDKVMSAKLGKIAARLEDVAKSRRKHHTIKDQDGSDTDGSLSEMIDDLSMVVEGLAEAETADSSGLIPIKSKTVAA